MSWPQDLVSLADYARHFASLAAPDLRAYIDGAAGDGITARRNHAAFSRYALVPRVLRDLRHAAPKTALFGRALAAPLLMAPSACHKLVCPEGERASARASALTGVPLVLSSLASVRLEDLADQGADLWLQLYLQPDFADTLDLVRRAERAGVRALVLTVDAPLSGLRNMEARAGFRLPPEALVNLAGYRAPELPSGLRPVFTGALQRAPRFEDLARLAQATDLPILAKGILHPQDACLALDHGARGVIVSNHGGRVLDMLPATLEMLPEVVHAVAGRAPVLLDGGVTRGTDIAIAYALGAEAVLIGRPVLHGLRVGAAQGDALRGLAHLLSLLLHEFDLALALTGCADLADLRDGRLRLAPHL